jgi:hypothetical protein
VNNAPDHILGPHAPIFLDPRRVAELVGAFTVGLSPLSIRRMPARMVAPGVTPMPGFDPIMPPIRPMLLSDMCRTRSPLDIRKARIRCRMDRETHQG